MARRKKTTKTAVKKTVHHRAPAKVAVKHRRRSHSGSGATGGVKSLVIDSLVLGAGAMIASFISGKLPIANPKIKALAPLGLGIALTSFSKGNKTMQKLGQGMMVGGVVSTTKSFVPSLGLAGDDLSGNDQMLLGAIEMYKEQNQALPVAPRSMAGDEFAGDELSGWVVN